MRILFITSTHIGDTILSTGLLAHLIETYPDSDITVACGPAAAQLFRHTPRVERVIVMRKSKFAGHWRELLRATIGRKWDLVLDLRGSVTPYLLWADRRHVLQQDRAMHRVPHIASLLGLNPPPSPKIWPGPEAVARATTLIPDGRTVLALGPTANWVKKAWPVDRFIRLIDHLTGPSGLLPGASILVEGGPGERESVAELLAHIPEDRLIDQVGSDLLTAFACFQRSTLFIGNDSGLMHLAAASGVPTLGLFGPTDEALYAPWGERAMSVRGDLTYGEIRGIAEYYDHTHPRSAMELLGVGRVAEAAAFLLRRCAEERQKPEEPRLRLVN